MEEVHITSEEVESNYVSPLEYIVPSASTNSTDHESMIVLSNETRQFDLSAK